MSNEILIGCDPELFVFDTSVNEYVSSHNLIPGTKIDPYQVKAGAVQVDGVAAEFNIQPAKTEDDFVLYINTVRDRLNEMVKDKLPSAELRAEPTAFFNEDYFRALPSETLALGCEPDYNAYTGEKNHPPGTKECFRTGSGHIHIGWTRYEDQFDPDYFNLCRDVVKQLDAVLYATSHTWDHDQKRRELYGARGSFRPKTFGVEYRPLSNAWLRDELTMRFVYRTAKRAVELFFEGVKLYE